ncbi:MAG: group II intron reverse transcriptase/maturase [Bdellovibrionaceae bacterium]|nr:group II intron reverse transcriptase/maturase [Pseudobdellovibrionaceae bacterium]
MKKSKAQKNLTTEWNTLDWRKLEVRVFKLQNRIFKASSRGDMKTVKKLQKTLMKSWSAKCLAVRRVTQDNRGKKTAGVDGVKQLTQIARIDLARNLKLSDDAKPLRRVWIPKPGTEEKRPLGIPTMKDRAAQALAKIGLEPEWEAQFEPNSYGFRPGRSCHDAIQAIYTDLNQRAKFVLDADIAKCFDRINHSALLEKLDTFPRLRRQIKAWMKAGCMDGSTLFLTEEGTPQGGVISPLLANIALHGLETAITGIPIKRRPRVVRYADDFVVIANSPEIIERCKKVAEEWLQEMGLELKPSKTRITHTFHEYQGNLGFDFLGFSVRQYPVGKYHTAYNGKKQSLGFKTLIKPSRKSVTNQMKKLGEIIHSYRSAPQAGVIHKLNPIISGWSNYYSSAVSKKTFSRLDDYVFWRLFAWANHRHPNKGRRWQKKRYWHRVGNRGWVFGVKTENAFLILNQHDRTDIVRHVKVQGTKSPYDGNWIYWSSRQGKHPQTSAKMAFLLKRQKGRCSHCGLFFKDGDLLEIDHIIPRSVRRVDGYNNLQVLHRHCHDLKTAQDRADEVLMTKPK